MKRTLLAASLLAVFGAANASGLSWVQLSTATRTEVFNPAPLSITPDYGGGAGLGTTVSLGYLTTATPRTVEYTFLGQESGFFDNFKLTIAPNTVILDTATIGSLAAKAVSPLQGAGPLSFRFEGAAGKTAFNGGAWCTTCSIGRIGTNMVVAGKMYEFVIGYNDSAGTASLGDWDDMVIGVNAIPEPETYAMLLAGLGLMGFVARRRKQQRSAV